MEQDLKATMQRGPMGRLQINAVLVCVLLNALDGFDVLAVAFVAPSLGKAWSLEPQQIGLLFSAGLFGMTVGSLGLAPLADRVGRRTLILVCLMLLCTGMLASASAASLAQLCWLRAYTGLGIGGMLAALNTTVAEYASDRRRDLAVGAMSIGYPLGATLGGLVSVYLVGEHGWPAVFLFGGAMAALFIPVVWFGLPESVDFLLLKRPPGALSRLNDILARLGRTALDALPPAPADPPRVGLGALRERGLATRTAMLCLSYFATMTTFYFVLNWTPKILVDAGLSVRKGISGAIVMNAGGVVGGLLFGMLTGRVGLARLTALCMMACGVATAAFGYVPARMPVLVGAALLIGFFLIASVVGLYASLAVGFPVRVRATGTGVAIGLGRLGAITGPYLGGLVIQAGWSRGAAFTLLAAPMLLAAVAIRRASLARPAD